MLRRLGRADAALPVRVRGDMTTISGRSNLGREARRARQQNLKGTGILGWDVLIPAEIAGE